MLFQRATVTEHERPDLDTNKIKEWRSIVTLIVFVLTSKLDYILSIENLRLKISRHQRPVPLPRTDMDSTHNLDCIP
jgi:hypothetical protein